MNTTKSPKVTRVLNGWYTIGGVMSGVEIIKDGGLWQVKKDEALVSLAESFESAKSFAFTLC